MPRRHQPGINPIGKDVAAPQPGDVVIEPSDVGDAAAEHDPLRREDADHVHEAEGDVAGLELPDAVPSGELLGPPPPAPLDRRARGEPPPRPAGGLPPPLAPRPPGRGGAPVAHPPRARHDDAASALHRHPCRHDGRLAVDESEGAPLAPERQAARSRPKLPEHEAAVLPHLDVDFDLRRAEVHPRVRMSVQDGAADLLRQVLAGKRMRADAPRTDREGDACTEAGRGGLLHGEGLEGLHVPVGLCRGADGHHAEDAHEDGLRADQVVCVDVDARLVRLRDALDALRREPVLDVRDEAVAELPPHVAALEGNLAESHEEDHGPFKPVEP